MAPLMKPSFCLNCHTHLPSDAAGTPPAPYCDETCRRAWINSTAEYLQAVVDKMPADIVDGEDCEGAAFTVDDLTVLLTLEAAWLADLVRIVRRGIEIRKQLDDPLVRLAVERGSAFRYPHPDESAGEYAAALIEAMSPAGQ